MYCTYLISQFRIFKKLLASRWREVYSFLGLKFQKAMSKIEVFQSLLCLGWRLEVPKLNRAETGNFNFACSLLKF